MEKGAEEKGEEGTQGRNREGKAWAHVLKLKPPKQNKSWLYIRVSSHFAVSRFRGVGVWLELGLGLGITIRVSVSVRG